MSELSLQIPVGDQPSDIERQIRNLVVDYISKPNWYVLWRACPIFAYDLSASFSPSLLLM